MRFYQQRKTFGKDSRRCQAQVKAETHRCDFKGKTWFGYITMCRRHWDMFRTEPGHAIEWVD